MKEIESKIKPDAKSSQDYFRVRFSNIGKVMLHFYYRIR